MDNSKEAKVFEPSGSNRNVIQSYIFSVARSRFNIVQMRILYRLVEFAQGEIEGILIKDNMCRVDHNLRHVDILLPIKAVIPEGSKHYEQARSSLKAMSSEPVSMYDSESKVWRISPIVYNIALQDRKGVLEFSVADWVWDSLLDFTYGYRQFELDKILSLKSANSMKMYALISGLKNPMFYTYEQLRAMFGVEGKYSQSADIVKRILRPCKEELDKVCPWSFDYRPLREGRKFVGVTLRPYQIEANKDQELVRKKLLSQVSGAALFSNVYWYMRYQMDFSPKELNSNKALLQLFSSQVPDPVGVLASLKGRLRDPDGSVKGKGWIINAIKSEVAEVSPSKK